MRLFLSGFLALGLLGLASTAEAVVTATIVLTELRVAGDGANNTITLRLAAGNPAQLQVLSGAVVVGTFARAAFTSIVVDAGGGDDTVQVSETYGAFTDTEVTAILGGPGLDSITGGLGAETLVGGPGNDLHWGGRGDDMLIGGDGDDQFVWNSGDGNDTVHGDAGTDILNFLGSAAAENVTLGPAYQGAQLSRDVGLVDLYVTTTETLSLTLFGGADTFTVTGGVQALNTLAIDAGDGPDTIVGGAGDDTIRGGGDGSADDLRGGGGNDFITPGPGNDVVRGGDGNDYVYWFAGDGNDTIDGDDGTDVFVFTGNGAAENLTVDLVSGRLRFARDVGAALQDLGSVERMQVYGQGAADTLTLAAGLDGILQETVANMGPGNDTVWMAASSGVLALDGGTAELDTLNLDAESRILDVRPWVIWSGGSFVASYVDVESVNYTNTVGTLPTVTITSPTSAASTTASSSFIALGGTAADAEGLTRVTWFNMGGGDGPADGTVTWSANDVPLYGGYNVIVITAYDSHGNATTDTISVTVGAISYTLAEGATGSFFDLDVAIANPNLTAAPATVRFLKEDGTTITQDVNLEAMSRITLHVDEIPGLENVGGVSTVVTSTTGKPLVVERTMFWDASGYGSHGGTAVDGPRTRWLFAEGSEGFFHTFVLLANAGATPSTVTLTFLREGSTPFVRTVDVPPASRVTVAANGIPELVNRSFSIVVDATVPIMAERAMYFGTARLFDGGHESAGAPAGSTAWFLAEGATGPFFQTFVLVGNPNPVPASVTLTFLTETGRTVVRHRTVPANGRLTVDIETEDPLLANAAVSTSITADQPVVAERAMYWPGPPSAWAEAHNSFGATALALKWALAEGRVGLGRGFQTYILLANPNTLGAAVRVTFLRADGSTVVKTFAVGPTSRYNVAVSSVAPELGDEAFGALIEVTNGVPISVERAMYSDAFGQTWAAGTNALATRVP